MPSPNRRIRKLERDLSAARYELHAAQATAAYQGGELRGCLRETEASLVSCRRDLVRLIDERDRLAAAVVRLLRSAECAEPELVATVVGLVSREG